MDFLKILKSFEDFVYEALIWLVLLPKTLLRIVISPRRMVVYAENELAASDEQRFGDSISPPLLLILCVILAHLVDLLVRVPAADTSDSLGAALLASEQNLLLYRAVAFGVWALAGAAVYLLGTGRAISRTSLRGPFYEQCYLVAPFALALSVGTSLDVASGGQSVVGALLVLSGVLWFWGAQFVWFRHRMVLSIWCSPLVATLVLAIGGIVNGLVGLALRHPGVPTPPEAVTDASAR